MNTLPLLQALIACPSVTPNDASCQDIIAKKLQTLNFKIEHLPFGDVKNLFATYGNASGPLIVFAGHTDVVPPGPESAWLSPPFTPTIRDGILYGRGATDMKSAIACILDACEKLLQTTPTFPGTLGILLTSDEEGPGLDGTRRVIQLLTERGVKIDYCIVGEASSEKLVGDQIRIGRRGSLHGKLTIQGKQGHVAFPQHALNPIHLSAAAIDELSKTVWDAGNAHFPATTLQITNYQSGTGALNVIPGSAQITFNFRYGTASSTASLKERSAAILNKMGLAYTLDWHDSAQPFLTKQGKLIAATKEAIKECSGLETQLSTGGGTSDARFIAPTGAEVIELGVINKTAHQVNECVALNDLNALSNIYYLLLKKLLALN